MNAAEVGGIVRTLLAALGGFAAGKGWIDQETGVAVSGAIATLAVAVWSVIQKRKSS